MRFVTNNLIGRTHAYLVDTLCALTIVFPSVVCVCSFCMYTTLETPWSTWIAQCLQLRPTTSPSTTTVSMVMRLSIQGRIFPKGGDDEEHPTIIPMYTTTTPQVPSGHTMRPQAYAIGHKVKPLQHASAFHSCETWLLPNAKTLCMLRNRGDNHGDARSIGQVHTEADQEVPQVELPRSYSGRTSGRSQDIRCHQREEDQRETDAKRLYSGRTSD